MKTSIVSIHNSDDIGIFFFFPFPFLPIYVRIWLWLNRQATTLKGENSCFAVKSSPNFYTIL